MGITVALAGHPNSGKTTVFNALTGSRQKVGNWPGVTVEKKEGTLILNGKKVTVVDLPGIYSLSATSIDERIARDFLLKERPQLVAVVIDASNLERNLYLPIQLMELGVSKVVLVFNMMDRVKTKGLEIDVEGLSRVLGIPIVETVANKGVGIDELKRVIAETLEGEPQKHMRSPVLRYKEAIEEGLKELSDKVEDFKEFSSIPSRWFSIRLLEGDPEYLSLVEKSEHRDELLRDLDLIRKKVEDEIGLEVEVAIIEWRYAFIEGLSKEFVKRKISLEDAITLSDKIDRVVTNRFLGLPIFLLVLWLMFKLTFGLGGVLSDALGGLITAFGNKLSHAALVLTGSRMLSSFVSDGIVGGVGAVVVFLPTIFLLFFCIAVIEETGYMARGAFVMDRIMHALGLHGKSFIPLVLGFGCNVPAIMATRTLENDKDRIVTILVNPLMSCSARLPIYVLFASAFFSRHEGTVIFSVYVVGVFLAIVLARLFKSVFFKGEPAPLIMELPPYHIPTWKAVFTSAWTRSSMFLRKAGTVIFAAVIVIWILSYFPKGVEYAGPDSYIGKIGLFFAPLLKPAGFGFWQAAVALLFGLLAKEVVVGTLGTLYGAEGESLKHVISRVFTPLSAYSFMIMSLIYVPCIATISVIRKETGSWRWTLFAVGYSLVLGWGLATLIYQFGTFFGIG